MSVPDWTKTRLIAWGKWGRESFGGWPTTSPLFCNPSGRAFFSLEAPKEIEEVDRIVAREIEKPHKLILIEHYQQTGSIRAHAERAQMSKSSYYRKLDLAEWAVHRFLEC